MVPRCCSRVNCMDTQEIQNSVPDRREHAASPRIVESRGWVLVDLNWVTKHSTTQSWTKKEQKNLAIACLIDENILYIYYIFHPAEEIHKTKKGHKEYSYVIFLRWTHTPSQFFSQTDQWNQIHWCFLVISLLQSTIENSLAKCLHMAPLVVKMETDEWQEISSYHLSAPLLPPLGEDIPWAMK